MGKQLVITEKPSVARDVAKALKVGQKSGHFENGEYVIGHAVGHLLELAEPETGRPGGKWKLSALPSIPGKFELRPIKDTEKALDQLGKLIKREDVDGLINACDAGREGELIFHNIVRHFGTDKPVRRLWLQSMTPKAIRDGFASLRDGREMVPLQDAAVSRSEADWLIGINSTRAMTALNSPGRVFNLTTVGRVQTPTLAMLVAREREIREFKPRTYWEVKGTFAAEAGSYEGTWTHPAGHKPAQKGDRNTWLFDGKRAEDIVARCNGKDGRVTETKKPSKMQPPQLFDLTSLQREANQRFGFAAKSTLAIAQALYESQAITYPRTDSRRLPEDYPETAREILGKLGGMSGGESIARLAAHATAAKAQGMVPKAGKRVFDNSKVSDHFAIIPTGEPLKGAQEPGRKLYELIATRFVATFFPAAQLELTERRTEVEGETFVTRGRVVVEPGWLAVAGKAELSAGKKGKDDDSERELTPVKEGETVRADPVEAAKDETKPPRRYTEATLLSAMESAGKFVEDEEMRESLKERGLGTPATRAATIEGLIREKYVTREERSLVPSEKAFSLLKLLGTLDIDVLTKPELTGEWEGKLKQIEAAKFGAADFMAGIRAQTEEIVRAARRFNAGEISEEAEPTGVGCPSCKEGELLSAIQEFRCGKCGHSFRKVWSSREIRVDELRELVASGRIGPFDDFVSARTRNRFKAALILNNENKPEYEMEKREPEDPAELAERPRIGLCPQCKEGQLIDTERNYRCERGTEDPPQCEFSIGKTILQREITLEVMQALLEDGKTDELAGFVSKRTGRPFKAHLKLEEKAGGKIGIGFEFAPREGGGKGAAKPRPKPREEAPPAEIPEDSRRLGTCPACKEGQVADTPEGYRCGCGFKVGKVILQRDITPEDVTALLKEGKTGLLSGFVSRRTGRPFKAHLKVEVKDGKTGVGFEFAPR